MVSSSHSSLARRAPPLSIAVTSSAGGWARKTDAAAARTARLEWRRRWRPPRLPALLSCRLLSFVPSSRQQTRRVQRLLAAATPGSPALPLLLDRHGGILQQREPVLPTWAIMEAAPPVAVPKTSTWG